jgi:hypothetical protein
MGPGRARWAIMESVAVTTSSTPPTAPIWSRRQQVVLTLVLAAGLFLIVAGFRAGQTGDADTRITDPAIEKLIPSPGDLVLRQGEVGIDLAPGFAGQLAIDGKSIATHEVGESQTPTAFDTNLDARFDPGNGTVLFTPRAGAPIEAFSPGKHTIVVTYWRVTEGKEQAKTFSWQFSVS